MDPEKVKAIREWSSPKNVFEVRSFHGLESFYHKFIINFSGISAQMMGTMKKRHNYFKWIKEDEKIFNIIKENITKQPVLVLAYSRKTFQVRCDASGVAIGPISRQYNKHVAYFSDNMNDTKKKYSTYEKAFVTHPLP
jgi:hypothetical protein